jgi:hypothetical protein
MILVLNLSSSIFIISISFAIGGIVNIYLSKNSIYKSLYRKNLRENFNYNYIGLNIFHAIVVKTFYSRLNNIIRFKTGSIMELAKMRVEMINSEVGHLVGLLAAQLIIIILIMINPKSVYVHISFDFLLISTFLNIIFNLYPIILQWRNRSRVERILIHKSTSANIALQQLVLQNKSSAQNKSKQ